MLKTCHLIVMCKVLIMTKKIGIAGHCVGSGRHRTHNEIISPPPPRSCHVRKTPSDVVPTPFLPRHGDGSSQCGRLRPPLRLRRLVETDQTISCWEYRRGAVRGGEERISADRPFYDSCDNSNHSELAGLPIWSIQGGKGGKLQLDSGHEPRSQRILCCCILRPLLQSWEDVAGRIK